MDLLVLRQQEVVTSLGALKPMIQRRTAMVGELVAMLPNSLASDSPVDDSPEESYTGSV